MLKDYDIDPELAAKEDDEARARRKAHVNAIRASISKNGTPAYQTLLRRTEHMVYACYVVQGTVLPRSITTSLFLLKVFENEPPTSEMMLRLVFRLNQDLFPSEQLQKEYSLATVAYQCWTLLAMKDPVLHAHLQEFVQDEALHDADPDTSTYDDDGDEAAIQAAGGSSTRSAVFPKSYVLVRGWLESCFVGWLPEHGVLFLWDQLIMRGATPSSYKGLLPRFCCCLLQLLRGDLLESQMGLLDLLRSSGRKLRTKAIMEAVRALLSDQETAADLEVQLRNEAVIIVQRIVRGKLARSLIKRRKLAEKMEADAKQREEDQRRANLLSS